MTIEIVLPKIGFSMEEGSVTEWLVPDGGSVTEGQPLYLLESDKSIQEVEAPASGKLTVVAELKTIYPVGTVLARIE